jgi:hypothetical protein
MLSLLKTSRDLQMLFAAVTHIVEGPSLDTLLVLKVEKPLICLVGTRRPTVSMWPCRSSSGKSPASHRGGPGSNPGLVMWDFVMDKSGTGAGFIRVLRYPLPSIPSNPPLSYSPGAGTIGLLVAAVPSGPNWTPPPTIPI